MFYYSNYIPLDMVEMRNMLLLYKMSKQIICQFVLFVLVKSNAIINIPNNIGANF